MKYMGSKNRIAKDILPIILKDRISEKQYYVEPFCGGCNLIDKVKGNRIASDINKDLINLLIGLQNGWFPKETYTKNDYINAKNGLNKCPVETGYISINCSYSGKYWGRFAGKSITKQGLRDYTNESYKNIIKQTPNLKGIEFYNLSYDKLNIPNNSIIYCDIPYKDTYSKIEGYYTNNFNYENFYNWCKYMKEQGHQIFVSEYNMPDDFICVWQKEVSSSLSANGKIGGNKISVEKLFTI